MIWNDSSIAADTELDLLATHIISEIKSAGEERLEMPGGDELARAVAESVLRHTEGTFIPSDYLLIMTCRALWAVGHEQAARSLLRSKGPLLNISESYTDAIFGRGLFPCLGMHSSIVRALKPSISPWSMNGACWILNLRAVFSFLDTGLELAIWRVLHALTQQLAVLWDSSDGRGTLGLNNSQYLAANVLGLPAKSKRCRRFAAELISYCEQDLKIASDERKWRFTPMVMEM